MVYLCQAFLVQYVPVIIRENCCIFQCIPNYVNKCTLFIIFWVHVVLCDVVWSSECLDVYPTWEMTFYLSHQPKCDSPLVFLFFFCASHLHNRAGSRPMNGSDTGCLATRSPMTVLLGVKAEQEWTSKQAAGTADTASSLRAALTETAHRWNTPSVLITTDQVATEPRKTAHAPTRKRIFWLCRHYWPWLLIELVRFHTVGAHSPVSTFSLLTSSQVS